MIASITRYSILFLLPCDTQLEKGVDGLFDSFARLDSRISSVGQTAAKIGDHLQVKPYATPDQGPDFIYVEFIVS